MINQGNKYKLLKIIAFLYPAVVIFGSVRIADFKILGLVPTIGRVLIPFFSLILVWCRFREKRLMCKSVERSELSYYFVLLSWIAYGIVTLTVMPFSDTHDGLLEILSLVLGVMIVASIVFLCKKDTLQYIVLGLKVSILGTLVIAIYEIVTAQHLATSRYCDPEFIKTYLELLGDKASGIEWHIATSIFYDENTYAALLAVFSPFLIINQKNSTTSMRGINLLIICISFSVMYFNNAFICYVAMLIAVATVVAFGIKENKERFVVIGALVTTRVIVMFLEKVLGVGFGMGSTLLAQLGNRKEGIGSITYRLNTYKEALVETIKTSKGMGFGAGSFSNYFGQFTESRSMMSNPHCYWIEIVAEYGFPIFVIFVTLLIVIMARLIMKAKMQYSPERVAVIGSGFALIIASVAPSTYIKSLYLWIPIGMAIYFVDWSSEKQSS